MVISVILADDHAVLRDGLGFLLRAEPDIEVVGVASNGRDAVNQIKQLRPDVAVLDIAMPEMNGLEVARLLQQANIETRIIILSMYSAPEFIAQALRAGVRGYILKESAGDELIEAVHLVHSGERFLSPSVANTVIDFYVAAHQDDDILSPLDKLTPREREVLQLIAEGQSSAEIADHLSISPRTVDTYRSRIMRKLEIDNIPGLVVFAIRYGIIAIE
jgi:RNA polymerase sigma factor (sigma-70 family)